MYRIGSTTPRGATPSLIFKRIHDRIPENNAEILRTFDANEN